MVHSVKFLLMSEIVWKLRVRRVTGTICKESSGIITKSVGLEKELYF